MVDATISSPVKDYILMMLSVIFLNRRKIDVAPFCFRQFLQTSMGN